MITTLRNRASHIDARSLLIAAAVLALAFLLGQRASSSWLGWLVAGMGALVLLARPSMGLFALMAAALFARQEIGTGTEVSLNLVTLLVPAVVAIWLLNMVSQHKISFVASRSNRPLLFFLLAGLVSLALGIATWDVFVPRKDNFILVQLAQWGIFALSAGAFWLTANLIKDEGWLRRLTWGFLLLAGTVAIWKAIPGGSSLLNGVTTIAFYRPPFWVLLFGLTSGQLLFNSNLRSGARLFLLAVLGATLFYAFVEQKEAASNWVGLVTVLGVLGWLRFPRLRWPLLSLILVMAIAGVLFPAVYDFAGGDREWALSGGSRLALGGRVIELTMRNPITGLGPAAYRPYGLTGSLQYGRAFYQSIALSSHNNYVDIFSHTGLVGLALFGWFAVEIARLGYRLHRRYRTGFAAAYVNGMLATGAGALVIMALADWILPFVYNIGFPGFQASVLLWLFLGGLVALDAMPGADSNPVQQQPP